MDYDKIFFKDKNKMERVVVSKESNLNIAINLGEKSNGH